MTVLKLAHRTKVVVMKIVSCFWWWNWLVLSLTQRCCSRSAVWDLLWKYCAHSEHRFPAPSSREGCRKPVLGVWELCRYPRRLASQTVKDVQHPRLEDWVERYGWLSLDSWLSANREGHLRAKSNSSDYPQNSRSLYTAPGTLKRTGVKLSWMNQ